MPNPNLKAGPGRPKGLPNRATQEAKEFAASILDSPEYRASLERRVRAGTLAPAVEQLLYYYRYGKPKERVEMEVVSPLTGEDLSGFTLEQLAERNRRVHEELQQELEAEKMAAEVLAQKAEADKLRAVMESNASDQVM